MNDIIRKYIGKPYQHNGRSDKLDCLGLVVSFLNDNGMSLPENDGNPILEHWYREDPERLVRGFEKYGEKIPVDQLQPFDVVVFSFQGIPRHAGVMVDRSNFMHARQGKDVAVIRLKHYMKFFHSAYRIGGVSNG
ncbi:MAG: C40 family peptidase [Halanaerobiales bacterium]|nr:C40 family peptidase [Halanaerobiales bacterium]